MTSYWYSLAPLFGFNVLLLSTLLYFRLTYRNQDKSDQVDRKEHSFFLSRFFKEYWYWLTGPITKLLIRLRVTPNMISFMGLLLCIVSGVFFYKGMVGPGGWFMIFGATFDMFDGLVARMTNQESKSGAFFDSVIDRYSEGVVLLGLAAYYRNHWMLFFVVLALIGSMMVSYTRARGEGVGVDCKAGMMQRPERIVYLGVGSIFSPILAALISVFFHVPADFMTMGAILVIAIFTNITAFERMRFIMKELEK